MWFTYVLRSHVDNGYYIGFTGDIQKRIIEHQDGSVDSTKNRRPIELIYYEAYAEEAMARQRESKLKQFGSSYVGLLKRLGERS